jgi:hypothetical protein
MTLRIHRERWNGRDSVRLSNGVFEVVALPGGGHLAELRLANGSASSLNCLWTPSWPTADPNTPGTSSTTLGDDAAARFLAGYSGHALCLNLFGPPSLEEAALGVGLHGEAAVLPWEFEPTATGCIGRVELPVAQVGFERRLSMDPRAPVLFIEERIESRSNEPRDLHWVQHLTLGPPFLATDKSVINASLDRGLTWPLGYEGHEILPDNAPFTWPYAPTLDGGVTDLRVPFAHRGTGFVAAARVSPERDFAFIAALNFRLGLALVYCFRRRDFPWIAIWEENCARTATPWNGTTRARGMEFGTTPMPVGRDALCAMGTLFDTPSARTIAPCGVAQARYLAALTTVPTNWRSVTDVRVEPDALRLIGDEANSSIAISGAGLLDFLEGDSEEMK